MKAPLISSKFAAWFVPLVLLLPAGCETSKPSPATTPAVDKTDHLDLNREKHAAVLFQTNKTTSPANHILVVGGIDGPAGSTHFANIYNPAPSARTWSASLHPAAYNNFGVDELARLDVRATVMEDDKILVTGGSTCEWMMSNAITCTPGTPGCAQCDNNSRQFRGSLLLFNPEKPPHERWSNLGWTIKPRTRHTVTKLPMPLSLPATTPECEKKDGEILYLLGGLALAGEPDQPEKKPGNLKDTLQGIRYVPRCPEIIKPHDENDTSISKVDLKTKSIELTAACNCTEWSGHTATLLPSDSPSYELAAILVVGHITDKNKCEASIVRPGFAQSEQWTPVPTPPNVTLPCDGHSAEVIGNKGKELIAIVGGEVDKNKPLKQILLFDSRAKTWTVVTREVGRSFAATAVTRQGALIIAGGWEERNGVVARGASVEKYDPSSNQWYSLPPMKFRRAFHTITNFFAKGDANPAENFLVVGGAERSGPEPGESVEILYLNEGCGTHSDCSPGNVCNSGLCETK